MAIQRRRESICEEGRRSAARHLALGPLPLLDVLEPHGPSPAWPLPVRTRRIPDARGEHRTRSMVVAARRAEREVRAELREDSPRCRPPADPLQRVRPVSEARNRDRLKHARNRPMGRPASGGHLVPDAIRLPMWKRTVCRWSPGDGPRDRDLHRRAHGRGASGRPRDGAGSKGETEPTGHA